MNTVPGNSVITPTDLYVLLPLITKFLFIVKPAAPEKGIEKACREVRCRLPPSVVVVDGRCASLA